MTSAGCGHDPEADHAERRRSAATTATSTRPMTARPAANLPLMTSSRWIGWDSSRGSVPSARSLLIASKANASPSSGADDRDEPDDRWQRIGR